MKVTRNPNAFTALPGNPNVLRWAVALLSVVVVVLIFMLWADSHFLSTSRYDAEIGNIAKLGKHHFVPLIQFGDPKPGQKVDEHGCYAPNVWHQEMQACAH